MGNNTVRTVSLWDVDRWLNIRWWPLRRSGLFLLTVLLQNRAGVSDNRNYIDVARPSIEWRSWSGGGIQRIKSAELWDNVGWLKDQLIWRKPQAELDFVASRNQVWPNKVSFAKAGVGVISSNITYMTGESMTAEYSNFTELLKIRHCSQCIAQITLTVYIQYTHREGNKPLLMLCASVYFPMLSISGNLCRDSLASLVFIALTE